jgi:hypothetical protein
MPMIEPLLPLPASCFSPRQRGWARGPSSASHAGERFLFPRYLLPLPLGRRLLFRPHPPHTRGIGACHGDA